MILTARNLTKDFPLERGVFKGAAGTTRALDDVSFSVEQGETLGIVGESGSGKSTLARVILKLIPPTSGTVEYDPAAITRLRKDIQIIFQNPFNSLDPRMKIIDTLSEPLLIHKLAPASGRRERAAALLRLVGLKDDALNRYPREFSGGQRQRICVARALAVRPKMLVLDEPISSLDLTLQADMLDLFARLKEELNLTYIFISHNLGVVKWIASRIMVMRKGTVVEENSARALFEAPRHPYTKALIHAARL